MRRLAHTTLPLLLTAPILLLSACDSDNRDELDDSGINADGDDGDVGDSGALDTDGEENTDALTAMFDAASSEFNVPSPILRAVAQVETRWQMVQGMVEFDGQEATTGIMGLRGAALDEGAALAGVTKAEAGGDPLSNIRAGAALLSSMADQHGIADRNDFEAWAPVLAEYSGIEVDDARNGYVFGEVLPEAYAAVENDGSVGGITGVTFKGSEAVPAAPGPNYAGSIWRASPNHSARPAGTAGKPSMVIIHTCEGSYSGCWGWLVNSQAGVSAHYVVNNTGSEISQLVDESRKAWHIAAKYDCSLNSSVDCGKNGASSNNFTIGIEHAGYAKQASWDNNLYQASANLVCDITKDQSIPRDQYHIVGHGKLQPYNRIDPGPNWNWAKYLDMVNVACGANPQPDPDPVPEPDPSDSSTTSSGSRAS